MKLPGWRKGASRREEWRPVLAAEVKRWSAMPCEQILVEVPSADGYQVEFQGKQYNVEIQILEDTKDYVHVEVGVGRWQSSSVFPPIE